MMRLIIIARCEPLRHRLNALAIARPNESYHEQRAHPPPCLVTEVVQERLEPALKRLFPL
jgi:hypothetical protein